MPRDRKDTAIHTAYDDYPGFDPVEPERNLLLAVLRSALRDLESSGEAKRQATEFFMDEDEEYVFSFRSICDFLNVDPSRVLTVTGLNLQDLEASTDKRSSQTKKSAA